MRHMKDAVTQPQTETPEIYLKRVYAESLRANPKFSLRSFARKLGLSSGGLSHILNSKKKLSVDRAHEIATALKLNEQEKKYFLLLTQIHSTKAQARKLELYEEIQKLHGERVGTKDLSIEQFRLISEWQGFAILQYVSVISQTASASEIAHFFGISKTEVELTLERLCKLELIEKNEHAYTPTNDRVLVSSSIPTEAIQNYYESVNEKSVTSIRTQTPQEKVIGTEVFAFDPEQLEEVRKLTDQYLDGLLKLAKKGKNRNQVYQVFTNVFRLNTQPKKPKVKNLQEKP